MFKDFGELTSVTKKTRRKGARRRRLSFEQKTALVIEMMTKNADELTLLREVSGWGFNLSQVAEMTRYERSTALMVDLLRMCDDGHIVLSVVPKTGSPLAGFEYWFYTHDEAKRALKRKKML